MPANLSSVANIEVNDRTVTIRLSTREKIAGLHGDLVIPRSRIRKAYAAANGFRELPGMRAPGTGLPTIIAMGTWRGKGKTYSNVTRGEALVLDLRDHEYTRAVITTPDARAIAAQLG